MIMTSDYPAAISCGRSTSVRNVPVAETNRLILNYKAGSRLADSPEEIGSDGGSGW